MAMPVARLSKASRRAAVPSAIPIAVPTPARHSCLPSRAPVTSHDDTETGGKGRCVPSARADGDRAGRRPARSLIIPGVTRLRRSAGWLLLAQAVVLGTLWFWVPLVLAGIGPPDIPLPVDERRELNDQIAGTSAVLVVLAVTSALLGVTRLAGRPVGAAALVALLVGGAVAVGMSGSTVLAVVLVFAVPAWTTVLRADAPARVLVSG